MSAVDMETMVRRYNEELYNRGNLAAAGEWLDADYVRHDPASPGLRGLDGMRQFVATYRQAVPDLVITIEDVIVAGDRAVYRWTGRGTQRGELMGIPPTGKQATVGGINIARFAGGKIVEEWSHWDQLGLLQQLGAIPTPK